MDKLTRAFYESALKVYFHEKDGNAFQDLFSDIMDRCHPGDFQRVRPWGSQGDRKNDGYLRTTRTLFQVYAPNDMTANKAVSKIQTDFKGALPYWRSYFSTWIFVHNSMKGLSPAVLKALLDLETSHTQLTIRSWGYSELRQKVFSLTEADLASIFGPMPSSQDMMDVRFSDIEDVVTAIAEQPSPSPQEIRPVPSNKLAYNQLAEDTEVLITWGMRKAHLVGHFFDAWQDPEYGDKIAAAFRQRYIVCRNLQMSPDDIFHQLHLFAGGNTRQRGRREAAALAVLAYLFEQCEIFERPPTGAMS